jgi:sialate O-acetylesterase
MVWIAQEGDDEMKKSGLTGLVLSVVATCYAELSLPVWVSDHMMLPANRSFTLSGTVTPGATVTVEFADQKKTVVADNSGSWTVTLDPMPASRESRVLKISCNHQSAISNRQFVDVLIGDIWLCAGQSNMQRQVKDSAEADEAVNDIQNVVVRCFNGSRWMVVNEENVVGVSAVGVWFAVEMAQRQDVPVGIYVAARGGTGIEAWVPVDAFPDTSEGRRLKLLVNNPEVLEAADEDAADFKPWGQHRLFKWGLGRAVPSRLFEQLIRPVGELPVRGVVWYQGESNADHMAQALEYHAWLKNLIPAYRSLLKSPELPFVIIQLPSYDQGSPEGRSGWKIVQDAQSAVVADTSGAMLVDIKDLGDLKDIHPRRKKEVGIRAANAVCTLLQK